MARTASRRKRKRKREEDEKERCVRTFIPAVSNPREEKNREIVATRTKKKKIVKKYICKKYIYFTEINIYLNTGEILFPSHFILFFFAINEIYFTEMKYISQK